MPSNSWSPRESDPELDPIGSLLSEKALPEEEEEEFRRDFFSGSSGRRKKAAFVLMTIWGVTIGLHFFTWGSLAVASCTGLIFIHVIRLVVAKSPSAQELLTNDTAPPSVSLLVAAKNEEAVIGNLVQMLCSLDYPGDKYEVWIIDDNSKDNTGVILDQLAQTYPQLKVLHRQRGAVGGKSGALNQVLPLTKGEIIGVFDADATVEADLLRRVVPMFEEAQMGAVQVRKAIANASCNFWTQGQKAEMALDSYFQQQRIAIGGLGELRGNGQFVRRSALNSCGGWNEETITDDLDLTIRLHLDRWKIGFLALPAVEEEGVTRAMALWHQRNRWAEGGYQRYLDYWRFFLRHPLGWSKTWDLFSFLTIQYVLPVAALPDLFIAIARHRYPLLAPMSGLMFSISAWSMFVGLRRTRIESKFSFATLLSIGWQTLRGMIYMVHWLVVMPSVTARVSVRPKRLKWVKTVHEGGNAVIISKKVSHS